MDGGLDTGKKKTIQYDRIMDGLRVKRGFLKIEDTSVYLREGIEKEEGWKYM